MFAQERSLLISTKEEQFSSQLASHNSTRSESLKARPVWVKTPSQRLQAFISGEKHLIELILNSKW